MKGKVFNTKAVKDRLTALGYTLKDADDAIVSFSTEKVRNLIMSDCNVPDVPEGLFYIAVDMAAGEFLRAKKTFAPDDLEGFDLGLAVSQIQEGDTNISFGGSDAAQSDEQRLNALIDHLINDGRGQFAAFRRIRW
ncbi:MAG: hypothetical protein J1F63_00385 [Oscillospiraceae bacterium]|nr:hypothetical protein [Oscillospiraceae bacterium]